MRRGISLIVVGALLVGGIGLANAGGRHGHGHHGAIWWGIGAGIALGTLGILAARAYAPIVPYP